MTISELTNKQKRILSFVVSPKKYLICDGAVRSGKTVIMVTGFFLWAMENFNKTCFAICGKTVASVERNIIDMARTLDDLPYRMTYKQQKHVLIVQCGSVCNRFYIFGGKDSQSASLIQGLTLSGILFDEVVLMNSEFVEQAIARTLTVANAKLWFNMNPGSPRHWFYQEWVLKAEEKGAIRIRTTMADNPIVTEEEIEETKKLFSGVFYSRFIDGEWVNADGIVYDVFDERSHIIDFQKYTASLSAVDYAEFCQNSRFFVSVDYGTVNPMAVYIWCLFRGVSYCVGEYYWDSRETGRQLTDEEHYQIMDDWFVRMGVDRKIETIVIDPSATSFKATIRHKGKYGYTNANNDVIPGIRYTAGLIKSGRLYVDKNCKHMLEEFGMYTWDTNSATDTVVKEFDHAMDSMRYYTYTILFKDIH